MPEKIPEKNSVKSTDTLRIMPGTALTRAQNEKNPGHKAGAIPLYAS
jgi:hypothetical protein